MFKRLRSKEEEERVSTEKMSFIRYGENALQDREA